MATVRKRRGHRSDKTSENPDSKFARVLASHGIDYDTIGSLLNPPCSGAELREKFPQLDNSHLELVLRVDGALGCLIQGRPAEYDNKGRLIRSEVKPNSTVVRFLFKHLIDQRLMPTPEPEKIDISQLSSRQLDDLKRRILQGLRSPDVSAVPSTAPPQSNG